MKGQNQNEKEQTTRRWSMRLFRSGGPKKAKISGSRERPAKKKG